MRHANGKVRHGLSWAFPVTIIRAPGTGLPENFQASNRLAVATGYPFFTAI